MVGGGGGGAAATRVLILAHDLGTRNQNHQRIIDKYSEMEITRTRIGFLSVYLINNKGLQFPCREIG